MEKKKKTPQKKNHKWSITRRDGLVEAYELQRRDRRDFLIILILFMKKNKIYFFFGKTFFIQKKIDLHS
jgi:hypothetical protein